jgi:hypothetical protein
MATARVKRKQIFKRCIFKPPLKIFTARCARDAEGTEKNSFSLAAERTAREKLRSPPGNLHCQFCYKFDAIYHRFCSTSTQKTLVEIPNDHHVILK